MYSRHIDYQVKNHFQNYKENLILLGSRQVGKTTLLQKIFPQAQYLLVDNEPIRQALETYDINIYKQFLNQTQNTIIIDEIQLLKEPGRCAKIIYDQISNLKLIITGSSSINIKNKSGESLAGRKIDYYLFPLTFSEYLTQNKIETELNYNIFEKLISQKPLTNQSYLFNLEKTLDNILLYGLYPQLVNYPQDQKYLQNFVNSLIFKDLLELNLIENRRVALNLLRLLAYQIGGLINYSELANKLKVDHRTVRRYVEIFTQSFIIFQVLPFSQNRRQEISKAPKIYFWDMGVRNALIDNFSSLDLRPDKGALFENFIISELLKANTYLNRGYQINYWRTKQGSEVDLVLSKQQDLLGIEIKYRKSRLNQAFVKQYSSANLKLINSNNFY